MVDEGAYTLRNIWRFPRAVRVKIYVEALGRYPNVQVSAGRGCVEEARFSVKWHGVCVGVRVWGRWVARKHDGNFIRQRGSVPGLCKQRGDCWETTGNSDAVVPRLLGDGGTRSSPLSIGLPPAQHIGEEAGRRKVEGGEGSFKECTFYSEHFPDPDIGLRSENERWREQVR